MGLAALKIEDLPHYTYDDYVQWEGNWELIHGIAYAMVPAPAKKHQRLAVKIAAQLETLLQECPRCQTYMPIDWQITEDTVVQPDVLVVCDDDPEQDRLLIPPVLVFEITSPSTARKDRILKYRLYEEAGVIYYCLVDPGTAAAEVFTLNKRHYRKMEGDDFPDGKILFHLGPCRIAFDFTTLFRK